MATYGEICYACLDLLKLRSDDAYFTEDHVVFIVSNLRNYLLEKKYSKSRNKAFEEISGENKQRICLDLEQAPQNSICGPLWLRSVSPMPETLLADAKVSVVNDLLHSQIQYVAPERMPFTGYNKWLHNIIYASKSEDGYLYIKSNNPQYINLKKVMIDGVFSDPKEAALLSCDENGEALNCDILDAYFPLESSLVTLCIELTVQELLGSKFAPEDKHNDARDDFGQVGDMNTKSSRPVERSERRRASETEEEQ